MLLGEKEFTPNWQPEDFDTGTVMGEETFTICIEAHADQSIIWKPVSHSWSVMGRLEESTTFTDPLGRMRLAQMEEWFNDNAASIVNEDPEFQGWRNHLLAEYQADFAADQAEIRSRQI